jgi:hypothetical protein
MYNSLQPSYSTISEF